jgi:hypothetical protein
VLRQGEQPKWGGEKCILLGLEPPWKGVAAIRLWESRLPRPGGHWLEVFLAWLNVWELSLSSRLASYNCLPKPTQDGGWQENWVTSEGPSHQPLTARTSCIQ